MLFIKNNIYNDPWSIQLNNEFSLIQTDIFGPDYFQIQFQEDEDLINIITWNDEIKHSKDDYKLVKHLEQHFNFGEDDEVIFSLIPDVQSELSIEYCPQYLFPFHKMENKRNVRDTNIFFFNLKTQEYVLYGLDDTVNGIQVFDTWEEIYETATNTCCEKVF